MWVPETVTVQSHVTIKHSLRTQNNGEPRSTSFDPQTGFLNLGSHVLGTPEDISMNVLLAHAEGEDRTRRLTVMGAARDASRAVGVRERGAEGKAMQSRVKDT